MRILAIETSGNLGSVAVDPGDGRTLVRPLSAARRHTAELVPAVQGLLAETGLTLARVAAVAWSCGPGSFTGLRIGAAFVRSLALATGCRVLSIDSLAAAARRARADLPAGDVVAPLVDAKRGQVYAAAYCIQADGLAETWAPRLTTLSELAEAFPGAWVAGEGLARHAEACAALGLRLVAPEQRTADAGDVLALARTAAAAGRWCSPDRVTPAYIRPPECEEFYEERLAAAKERRAARGRSAT